MVATAGLLKWVNRHLFPVYKHFFNGSAGSPPFFLDSFDASKIQCFFNAKVDIHCYSVCKTMADGKYNTGNNVTMEPLNASEYSKRRLILAALALFAEKGIDAVSLRMINREAGARNNSALHYHFGSKVGLVEAVVGFIQNWFEEVREQSLAAVEAAGDQAEVRDILEAFISPYLQLLDSEEWGYHAVRFLARMELEGGADTHAILNRFSSTAMFRLKTPLINKLSHIPPKVVMQRLNFCIISVIHGMADYKDLENSYVGDMSCSLQELGKLYLDYNTAGLSAPID